MATYDRTVTGGGTVGHPGVVQRPYVITSPVYDAVDNTSLAGDDVVKLIDLPADTVWKRERYFGCRCLYGCRFTC